MRSSARSERGGLNEKQRLGVASHFLRQYGIARAWQTRTRQGCGACLCELAESARIRANPRVRDRRAWDCWEVGWESG